MRSRSDQLGLRYVNGIIQEQQQSGLAAMDNAGHLHRYIYLYQSDSQLAFAATTSGSALIIDRATAKVSLQGVPCVAIASYCSAQYIVFSSITDSIWHSRHHQTSIGYCLAGRCLIPDTYVIVVTGRESVGHLASHEIWRLTKFEIIPLRLAKGQAIQVHSLC